MYGITNNDFKKIAQRQKTLWRRETTLKNRAKTETPHEKEVIHTLKTHEKPPQSMVTKEPADTRPQRLHRHRCR